jgi:NitT/TauT family transport system substrate-binding protein
MIKDFSRWGMGCSVTLLLSAFLIGDLFAQNPADRVRIGYATSSGQAAALWITQDAGFFKRNGLDVELIYMQGGIRVVQGIISSTLTLGWGGGADLVQARLAGGDVKIIAAFNDSIPYKLIAARSITRADQLKGQRLAVSSLGSSSHFWAKYALKQLGLDGERDMAAIAVGSDLARLASLESGAAQASAVEMVTAFIAQKKGFPILIDLTDDKLRFLGASVVAQSGVIERQTDACRRVIKSLVDGIHFMRTNKKDSMAIIGKRMRTTDEEIIEINYTLQGLRRTLAKPILSEAGIQTILTMLSERNPAARSAQVQQFVDG